MDKSEINKRIGNRDNVFYWQTDRLISVEEAAMIWSNRHELITNEYLVNNINKNFSQIELDYIKPFDENSQTSLGNVNSIRVGVLKNGEEIIIRCHPKGVNNEYFYAESLAASIALDHGLPAYKTLGIHDLENEDDISYQIIEKLPGDTVQFYLKNHGEAEDDLVYQMGITMANLHKIKVEGFGPFKNDEAKNGKLVGRYKNLSDAINAGLEENLERLINNGVLKEEVAEKMKELFTNNPLLDIKEAVLVHNDFADWNLLTDGMSITGIIDWDECVGGYSVEEIACWSTFFEPERLNKFLEGYFSVAKKMDNFEKIFELLRLRYTISKMALRTKRYTYEKTEFLKGMIEKGKKHLEASIKYFDL